MCLDQVPTHSYIMGNNYAEGVLSHDNFLHRSFKEVPAEGRASWC
ncbi:hypothetical protein [Devosia submarina]|nr:hypothetical protein [Devosia submarina]